DRDVGGDGQGLADVLERVLGGVVELVERHQERQTARLEVVDGGEAVLEPAGVDQHHGTDGAADQVVPHEPEPVLAGRAEQVQDQVVGEADTAEVHRHRGGRLHRNTGQVVDSGTGVGDQRLGA